MSLNIFRVIKSRIMNLAIHVAHLCEGWSAYIFLVGKIEGNIHWKDRS